MPDAGNRPSQDPAEGSRKIVDEELKKIPDENGGGAAKKPDLPGDGPRGGETNRTVNA